MGRSVASLVLGIVLGLMAVALMFVYIRNTTGNVLAPPAVQTATVVVAAKDLAFGKPIDKPSLKVVAWPKASIPQDAFTAIDDIFAGANGAGDRIALMLIAHDEPLTRAKVSGFGGRPTLSRQVENGKRAVSIRVDDVAGVAGFVLPGDRVDIMLTRNLGGSQNNLVTDILLQNIVILGIDQMADQQAEKPVVARTATVEVTPEEAQKLALAQQAGSLRLALRSIETAGEIATRTITESDLAGRRPAPPAVRRAAPAQAQPTVRVRYGDANPVEKTILP